MIRTLTRILAAGVILCCAAFSSHAQTTRTVPEGFEIVDSLVYIPTAVVDSSLVGKSIFKVMPSTSEGARADVTVHQSSTIAAALDRRIRENKSRRLSGFRVRIFFDNKQDARSASEAAAQRFQALHPGYAAYRSFAAPFFKVTVGDFRTRSEAMSLLQQIKGEFPSAFVIKENIKYPIVDKEHSYVTDTVYVLRPKTTTL